MTCIEDIKLPSLNNFDTIFQDDCWGTDAEKIIKPIFPYYISHILKIAVVPFFIVYSYPNMTINKKIIENILINTYYKGLNTFLKKTDYMRKLIRLFIIVIKND
jgi:hypothetical protein